MRDIKKRVRDPKLDIIRIFALICVVGVHFFLNCGFYDVPIVGKRMYVASVVRTFFITCVPLFLMLTGYLVNKKQLSKKYYKGIIKVLIIYAICSVIYSIFIKVYEKKDMNIGIFFQKLFAYKGSDYAWYIEMYVGLFLIIPFLNLIVNNLKSKKEHQILLITLIVLIGIPSVVNVEDFKIFSDWWAGIYPIFYYFLGAYLSRYTVNLKTKTNIVSLVIATILFGTFNYFKASGEKFSWESWNGYSSVFVMIESFLVFNLLLKIKLKKNNENRNKVLKILSDACLGAYLISCMYDKVIYDKLEEYIPVIKQRFIYCPIIIILCFTCSIITSIIINIIYNYFYRLIIKFKNKNNKEKNVKTIVLASNNKHKLKEFKEILKDYKIITLNEIEYYDDIEETGETFEENAMIKAETIHKYLKEKGLDYIVVAEDSGLCVDALNGAPGIYSARYAGGHGNDQANRDKLRKELEEKDRNAYFICTIVVYYPNAEHKTFVGKTYGKIIDEELGKKDFGYDPIFYSNDLNKTFGEALEEEKNSVSHRSRAIKEMINSL